MTKNMPPTEGMTLPQPSLNSASAETTGGMSVREKPRNAEESASQVSPQQPRRLSRPDARTRAESIKRSCRIEEVIMGQGVLLRVVGDGHHLVGICPFHQEERASFTVYPDTQSFCCFGCRAAGDVITFICLLRQVSFNEALCILGEQQSETPAQKALQRAGESENAGPDGVVLAPPAPLTRRQTTSDNIPAMKLGQSADLSTNMEEAQGKRGDTNVQTALAQTLLRFTQVLAMQGLARTPGALTYLGERGISYALAQRCRLGYLADDVLASLLIENPVLEPVARQIGLLNRGGRISLLRRLIVPEIWHGQTLQLIGRVVPGQRTPMAQNKYHLVCGTGEKHLLGYGAALQRLAQRGGLQKRSITRKERQELQGILVLEGALDYVIAAGWDLPVLPVALLSTYPSRRQLAELLELQQRTDGLSVVLHLDGDDPGREATARLVRILDDRQVRYQVLPPLPRVPERAPSYKDLGEIGPLGLAGRAQLLARLEHALVSSPATDTFSPDIAATPTTPATHDELATLSNAPDRQEGGC